MCKQRNHEIPVVRVLGEGGSNHLTAHNIAGQLDQTKWCVRATCDAYQSPQTRVRVSVETNTDLTLLSLETQRDTRADSKAFAETMVEVLGDQVSANDMQELILGFGRKLIAWGKQTPESPRLEMAYTTLETLLEEASRGTSTPD